MYIVLEQQAHVTTYWLNVSALVEVVNQTTWPASLESEQGLVNPLLAHVPYYLTQYPDSDRYSSISIFMWPDLRHSLTSAFYLHV